MKTLFETAIKDFDGSSSPLRLNYLCTTLRELSRLILHSRAPEDAIKACCWYTPVIENDREIITRSQRVHYAVHAGLPIEFVQDELEVDVNSVAKEFSAIINKFNKYTHLDEHTFDTESDEAELFAERALEAFSSLFETIDDCRSATQSAFASYAEDAIKDVLFDNVHSAIDQLSTHSSVSGVNVDHVTVDAIDPKMVRIDISGSVDCTLQYGSNSDYERGDGSRSIDSFPFTCKYEASSEAPDDLNLVEGSLHIDNTSFYEGQIDE